MAKPLVIHALERKYARLLGEYEVAEQEVEPVVGLSAIIAATEQIDRRKKEINEKLINLEESIWLFDPQWDPARITPVHARRRTRKPGDISRTAYGVLREAREPLTGRQLAREVASRFKLEGPDERAIARIESAIHNALRTKLGRGVYLYEGTPRRWAVFAPGATPPSVAANSPSSRAIQVGAQPRP
jgi:hypothetical protein